MMRRLKRLTRNCKIPKVLTEWNWRTFRNIWTVLLILHNRRPFFSMFSHYLITIMGLCYNIYGAAINSPVLFSPPVWKEYVACMALLLFFLGLTTQYSRKCYKTHIIGIIALGYLPWLYGVSSYVQHVNQYFIEEIFLPQQRPSSEVIMRTYWCQWLWDALRLQFEAVRITWQVINRSEDTEQVINRSEPRADTDDGEKEQDTE